MRNNGRQVRSNNPQTGERLIALCQIIFPHCGNERRIVVEQVHVSSRNAALKRRSQSACEAERNAIVENFSNDAII